MANVRHRWGFVLFVIIHTVFFFSFSLPVSAGFNLLYNLQNNNECEMLPCYTVRRLKVIVLFLAVSSICSTSTSIFILQHQQVFGVPFCRQDIDWMQLPVSQAGLYNDWFTFIRQSVRFSTELCIFSTGATYECDQFYSFECDTWKDDADRILVQNPLCI